MWWVRRVEEVILPVFIGLEEEGWVGGWVREGREKKREENDGGFRGVAVRYVYQELLVSEWEGNALKMRGPRLVVWQDDQGDISNSN